MFGDVRAELTKMLRRPATWLLVAVAAVLGLVFDYLVPYAGYAGGSDAGPTSGRGLAGTLPSHVVTNAISGSPIFIGALALILGVLVTGSEYGWSTWKTVLSQGPSRVAVFGAKLAAIAAGTLTMMLGVAAVGAAAAVSIAMAEDQPIDWPSASDAVLGLAGGWLVIAMWAMLGVLLAVAFRAVALPVGLGLVWLLAVQNLVAGLAAPLIAWVADLQTYLPGPNAGSLVASLGADTSTPGVAEMVGAGQAALVVAGYLVVFAAAGGWLLARRDIT